MSWGRTIDLYYDVEFTGSSPLLAISASSVSQGAAPQLVAGDHLDLRIFLRRKTSAGALEALSLPAGFAMIFAGKLVSSSAPSGDLLFSATSFTETGTGDDLHYAADLNLNTTDLLAAVSGKGSITARCDLQIQNADNSRRVTLQADFTVRNQAYAGEGAPEDGDPEYPLPAQIALREPEGGNYQIDGGTNIQFKNLETDAFETIEARIESGISLVVEGDRVAIYLNGVRRGLL